MNKSIKIAGIIFYVEQKCYKKLHDYLSTLIQYFSKYEEGREIVEDIEARIAEIFWHKKAVSQSVITETDIDEVIETIGGIEDFIEAEDNPAYQMTYEDLEIPTENDIKGTALQVKNKEELEREELNREELNREALISRNLDFQTYNEHSTDFEKFYEAFKAQFQETHPAPQKFFKKLFRDVKRKIFGGVASGLAYYFKIDRTLVRLAFATLFTGLWFIPALPQMVILIYLAGWIIIPAEPNLPDIQDIKKLYRNIKDQKIGGVASGIADFLGAEAKKVRLIFLGMSLLFGSGFFLYILMWIFMPKPPKTT
jgi:phage shock protein PspC (stress-responsive transcriptional regulator)